MPLKLHTIICSTRPGRVGAPVARWFHELAQKHAKFEALLVDIADFNLPVYDEPYHPRFQNYQHAHTKAWAASVQSADAFVFVTPEYNHGPPPALLNALDYVYIEWNYKPAAFVSYGGASGGVRAVQVEKLTLTTLKMVPILQAVTVNMVPEYIKDGQFTPSEVHTAAVAPMLDELYRWASALKVLREPSA